MMDGTSWPYPPWIAHRGAGKQAPENTIAAFRLGYKFGYRMFECDVKLSADDAAYLMHDATLERTTNGKGAAADKKWQELLTLDAGSWHSAEFAGEQLATLDEVAHFVQQHDCCINLEIKPIPGTEAHTGAEVARQTRRLWAGAGVPPLLSSFSEEALHAARSVVPELPRALLLSQMPRDWHARLIALDCVAMVADWKVLHEDVIREALSLGYQVLSYTVNDLELAKRLLNQGLAGIITDEVHRFKPDAETEFDFDG